MCIFLCVFTCPRFICMFSKARVCVYVWNGSVSGCFCSLLLQPDQQKKKSSSMSLVFVICFLLFSLHFFCFCVHCSLIPLNHFCLVIFLFCFEGGGPCGAALLSFLLSTPLHQRTQMSLPRELEKHLAYSCSFEVHLYILSFRYRFFFFCKLTIMKFKMNVQYLYTGFKVCR